VRRIWHVWGREEVYVRFWCGNLRELETLDVDGLDNIRMHIEEIGCEIVDWIHLAQIGR
jgi:hypothetical protein